MFRRERIVAVLVLLVAFGCARRREYASVTFESDVEHKTVVAIDMSISFAELMAEQGKAYTFLMRVLDKYGQDRTSDHIIIAQFSGNDSPLLFEGTAQELRNKFPNGCIGRSER